MVRTKADAGGSRKALGGTSTRKSLGGAGPSSASPSGKAANKYAGGNAYCPRPTPDWQKGIGSFFSQTSLDKENTKPDEIDLNKEGSSKDTMPGSSKDIEAGTSKDVEAGTSKEDS